MRKRLAIVLLVVGLVLFSGGYLWVAAHGPTNKFPVERVNAIRAGMTQTEVEGLLAAPPGAYSREFLNEPWEKPADEPESARWRDDAMAITIFFDEQRRVT